MKTLQQLGSTATIALLLSIALPNSVEAAVLGLKSRWHNQRRISTTPTHLFRFAEDGSSFTDLGVVTLNGSQIDADALAISQEYGLLGFAVTGNSSQLISIDSDTAKATALGSLLNGRDIRGATFDLTGNLWVLDAAENELLKIDPTTGQILDNSITLTFGQGEFDLSNASDIAVHQEGIFYIANLSKIYSLNVQTGALTEVNQDSGKGFVGLAFSMDADENDFFAYDVNYYDDIFLYDGDANYAKTDLFLNIISRFNGGLGDIAGVVEKKEEPKPSTKVPEPSSALALLTLGAFGVILKRKK
ncbi:MAG: PEP-CTERM sorting domain-containing protein [Hormoscilla sp.]